MLFIRKRLTFYRPNGQLSNYNGGAPSVLVAYGARDAGTLRRCDIPGKFLEL